MPQTFLNIAITVIFSAIAVGLIVFLHEFGHFLAAKKAGVIVQQFAFGFGPKLYSKKWHGTEYRINIIPVGGYIMMLGDLDGSSLSRMREQLLSKEENETVDRIFAGAKIDPNDKDFDKVNTVYKSQKKVLSKEDFAVLKKYIEKYYIPKHPGNFENISGPKKVGVIIAGVVMNLLLGIALFYVYFALNGGYTDLRKIGNPVFLGAEVNTPPVLWFDYSTDNIGEAIIIDVNGHLVKNEAELKQAIVASYDKPVNLYVYSFRQNKYLSIDYILDGTGIKSNFDADFYNKVLMDGITDNGPAALAGIVAGDVVLTINNEIPVSTDNFKAIINLNEGKIIPIKVLNLAGQQETFQIALPIVDAGKAVLGVSLAKTDDFITANSEQLMRVTYQQNSLFSGILHTINMTSYSFTAFGELINQSVAQNSSQPVSQSVSSILAVPDLFYMIIKGNNFLELINIAALVSASLAISNVLPIPLFDGGHLLFMLIEKIRGKKISQRTEEKVSQIFFYLLIGFSLILIVKDVLQFEWLTKLFNLIVGIFK